MNEKTKDKLEEAGGCLLGAGLMGGSCLIQCVIMAAMVMVGLAFIGWACG